MICLRLNSKSKETAKYYIYSILMQSLHLFQINFIDISSSMRARGGNENSILSLVKYIFRYVTLTIHPKMYT